ncbi:MAG: ATP-dependent DNA helicase [Patescibacteria group bacterium]
MSTTKGDQGAFNEAYKALNAAQREAVDSIEGPVMVIAGPGTGKTQILTLRIANILQKTDSKPGNVLALTFTESGASNMRERLTSLIGEAAYDVAIYTFHGFADSLIQKYPEAYPAIIGGRPASEIERVQIIEAILNDTSFKALRPSGDPAFYVKPILVAIQTLKQEYISPDKLAESVNIQEQSLEGIEQYHEKGAHKGKERGEYKDAVKYLERNRELLQAYRMYESALRADKLYDFDDMIIKTVEALTANEDMLRDLQEQFHYVLADEHQDVNGSQNKILELLVNFHEQPNLFVVGDEKQAIYRFQGASLDNFLYFESTFGETKTISLTDNYRSGQVILDAAHDLIKTDDAVLSPLRVPLEASAVKESVVEHFEFSHEAIEDSFVVDSIKRSIESGTTPDEMVVIVRTNREVEHFAALLRKQGIAAQPSADSDILEHPVTQGVLKLLKAVTEPGEETHLVYLLHEPYFNIAVGDLAKVLRAFNRALPLSVLLRNETLLKDCGVEDTAPILAMTKLIDSIRERSLTMAPHRLLEALLEESGLTAHVLASDPFEGVRVVRRLYDEVEGMVRRGEVKNLSDVVRRFALHTEYGIGLTAPFIPSGHLSVQVMTAHKSKGLEFAEVYVPHTTDRTWGNKKSRDLFKLPLVKHEIGEFDVAEDDERRLLYVAMTRAKGRLVLTEATLNVEGKEQTTSRFLSGLDSVLLTAGDGEKFTEQFSPVQDLKTLAPLPITTEVILETLSTRGFSPTAFNNYRKSPWEYFYRNVLQVPQIKTPSLQLGSAVHFVLDTLVRHHAKDSLDSNLGRVSELLKQGLSKEALTDEEFTRQHEKGLDILMAYGPHLFETKMEESKTEMKFEAMLETGIEVYPFLKLNGNLDRVDFKDGQIVRVVDYKTGKPKSRGQIEGTTADSDGDYKLQLTFYALLLSLQEDSNKHCRTGVLSFVEPDSHGQIKEETFVITDKEIEALKIELIRVTQEILAGGAFTAPCDPNKCHYCDLVGVWQMK